MIVTKNVNMRVPIKSWTEGVQVEDEAQLQLYNVSRLPFVGPHIAVMPDVHWGMGATVGSVVPTQGAIVPAAVGVDIGCGMIAQQLELTASDLPDSLVSLRSAEGSRCRGFRALKAAPEQTNADT